ncbi:MAG: GNAT family N-acetyltransferase [Anaerolineales bacterium]|nr:GNAT family N-acetyltransferase [Anaerolineales bacterium]
MSTIEILPINLKQASQAEYAALNRHTNRLRAERLPDDPPIPLEESIQNFHSLPPFVDVQAWIAWEADGEAVAAANVNFMDLEENRHMAPCDISVLPGYRRQGLGRQLLGLIVEAAQAEERRLLFTETVDRIPGGEAFMQRLGAQKGLEGHVNQLEIADLDRGLVRQWIDRARQRASGFELGLWDGPYPEEHLAAVAQLFDLTNQQPLGDLEIEDMHMTPEQLRQMEQNLFARGSQRWTFYVVETATGRFAGYTETVWNPNRPEVLRQDMTGIFPEFRNKGLGRWLKAAMLDKVLQDHPQIKYVRTQNADSNAAMLKINTELGFQPYMASTLWQVEVEQVLEYLGTTGN